MNQTAEMGAIPETSPLRSMSIFERAGAIFARPASAWAGLETRAQWWFPLLVVLILNAVAGVALYHRALLPMMSERWEQQVDRGQMTTEQVDRAMQMMSSPAGVAINIVVSLLVLTVVTFAIGLVIWFGVGFVLGTKLKYRHALEVAAWSGLINIPAQLIASGLAWSRQTFRGLHVGFGVLLPPSDTPSKVMTGLGAFLDGIGPLSVWYVAVGILGAAALSGAPRKSVAWVIAGLYLVIIAFFSALSALFAPGS